MKINAGDISCIILAGGKDKRVSGLDKGLVSYKNRPLIEHVIHTVQNQVDDIIISANRNIIKILQKYSIILLRTTVDHLQVLLWLT